MTILAIILFVVSAFMLGIGIRLTDVALLWKKVYKLQAHQIKTQQEIINNQNATIELYKKIMANGISFILPEQKN